MYISLIKGVEVEVLWQYDCAMFKTVLELERVEIDEITCNSVVEGA